MKTRCLLLRTAQMFALVAALALGPMPVLAVHSNTGAAVLGALETDGNVIKQSTGEDWETLFGGGTSGVGLACNDTGGRVGSGTATDRTCVSERTNENASIFTGGGSKDGLDIPNWAGKDGSVPDKDNIVTAFAARYTVVDSGGLTHKLLYFGGDRFADNGDAQIGFWFFQNPVSFNSTTGTFTGTHKNGDILILSNFTQGGTLTNILALKVVGYNSADGSFTFDTLASASAGTTFACNDTASDGTGPHTICAATNAGTTASLDPLYKEKFNTPAGTYPPVAFFEGGLDLSAFSLGGECFSSFLMETRSSQSITAVLKDFVLQKFQECVAHVVTEVHDSSHNPVTAVSAGTQVHDFARVTGEIGTSTPTGTVTFSFFNNNNCNATGAVIPLTCEINVPLTEITPPTPSTAGVATADMLAHDANCFRSVAAGTLSVGFQSYKATYNGDSLYPDGAVSDCEPFEVLSVASHITTRIVFAGTTTDITNALIDLGTQATVAVQDEATVTCDSGFTPTGTVTFTRYADGACTGTPTVDNCGGTGCQVNSSGKALSGVFTLGPNTLSYTAVYNGDSICRATPSGTMSGCEPVCAIKVLR